jgi:hypothetical protein
MLDRHVTARRHAKGMVPHMFRWWRAFTAILDRRRQAQAVARRLRMYVGTSPVR